MDGSEMKQNNNNNQKPNGDASGRFFREMIICYSVIK